MDVLCLGDGVGYDSCEIGRGQPDTRVSSFDYPGYSSAFAQRMIEDLRLSNVIQTTELPNQCFDALVCLDVLEHVPDPPTLVRDIANRLAPGAKAYISEAYGWVRPSNPTHLRSNLEYAGRTIRLFEKRGLGYQGTLDSTRILVFQKGGRRALLPRHRFRYKMLGHTARYEFNQDYPEGTIDMAAFVASAKD